MEEEGPDHVHELVVSWLLHQFRLWLAGRSGFVAGSEAKFGVRWYWILDPELRSLEVLDLGPERLYVHRVGRTDGVLDDVPGCPGLTLGLDALWAEVDRLDSGG